MRRREVIAGLAAVWPVATSAQPGGKPFRVAYLALLPGLDLDVVKGRLEELGYAQGKNLIFDFRSAERSERLPGLAAEIVGSNPDVIVAGFGTLTAKAAQAASTSIPIVFVSVGDPIGAGVVKSLSRPGGNVTGVTPQSSEIQGKRLQILEALIPGVRSIAVLMNPETPFTALALQELKTTADERGQHIDVFEMRTADQLAPGIEGAVKAGAAALVTLEDPLLLSVRRQIAELAAKARLPTVYGNREFPEAGGLLSYGVDRRHLYRRAAELVDKILKG